MRFEGSIANGNALDAGTSTDFVSTSFLFLL